MRKKISKQCIGAVLASMVLAAYPVSLVGAQIISNSDVLIPRNEIISLTGKELSGLARELILSSSTANYKPC